MKKRKPKSIKKEFMMIINTQIKPLNQAKISMVTNRIIKIKSSLFLFLVAPSALAAANEGPLVWVKNITDIVKEMIELFSAASIMFGFVLFIGGVLAIKRGTKEQGSQQTYYYVGGGIGLFAGIMLLYMTYIAGGTGAGVFGAGNGTTNFPTP